jgi:hypothetical protein
LLFHVYYRTTLKRTINLPRQAGDEYSRGKAETKGVFH